MLRQMPYEARWVAITHYYHTVLHKKMTKDRARKERPPMTREEYLDVIPSWCSGKSDGWQRWWIGGSDLMQSLWPQATSTREIEEQTEHTLKETGATMPQEELGLFKLTLWLHQWDKHHHILDRTQNCLRSKNFCHMAQGLWYPTDQALVVVLMMLLLLVLLLLVHRAQSPQFGSVVGVVVLPQPVARPYCDDALVGGLRVLVVLEGQR